MAEQMSGPVENSGIRDAGLRCPRCDYNLTGLPEPRCPECGTTFNWDQVRQAAANAPRIAFERARRWRKLPGLGLTWLTVLFAPWVFAKQITRRVSTGHALVFASVCFASTTAYILFEGDLHFILTWLTTALIYLVLQTIWLTLIDPTSWRRPPALVVSAEAWRRPLATLHFWALAGCYTSAIMVTEFGYGPPPVFLEEVLELLRSRVPGGNGMYSLSLPAVICWTQMAVWLAGLGFCYYARHARARVRRGVALPATLMIVVSLFFLYAAVLDHVGYRVWEFYDRWF